MAPLIKRSQNREFHKSAPESHTAPAKSVVIVNNPFSNLVLTMHVSLMLAKVVETEVIKPNACLSQVTEPPNHINSVANIFLPSYSPSLRLIFSVKSLQVKYCALSLPLQPSKIALLKQQ